MRLYFLAGEPSGDILGADLISALQQELPRVEITGAGGPRMRGAGQVQSLDLAAHAVMGLGEVLKHYTKFRGFFYQLLAECEAQQPDGIVLIDNPGFNLRFVKEVRARCPRAKIIYYVSPQLWAWKPERARILEKFVDVLMCIFPFEPDWYSAHAPTLQVVWVGHPILDRLNPPDDPPESSLDASVALMAGSRRKEIERHLPLLLEAASLMHAVQPRLKFFCLAPSEELAAFERRLIDRQMGFSLEVPVRVGYTATHLSRIHLAIITSGTATLECAVAGTPMVMFYRVNALTYAIARRLVKVPFLGIVNLLLNEEAVPELIQDNANPALMARTAMELLGDTETCRAQRAKLRQAVRLLGAPGASRRAARVVLKVLRGQAIRDFGEDELEWEDE